jgi:hypothetical protein
MTVTQEFEGVQRTSPITGKPELYFDHHQRYIRMAVSIPVIALMLSMLSRA